MIFCDYLGLMRPEQKLSKSDLYEMGKQIAVELRGLAFEFEVPIMSVSQLNRGGSRLCLADVDTMDIAESFAISSTADAMFVIGFDEENTVYENEVSMKVLKNRFGGRIGDILKFYLDPRSLKMYDSMEMEQWFNDAMKSGCLERKILEKTDD